MDFQLIKIFALNVPVELICGLGGAGQEGRSTRTSSNHGYSVAFAQLNGPDRTDGDGTMSWFLFAMLLFFFCLFLTNNLPSVRGYGMFLTRQMSQTSPRKNTKVPVFRFQYKSFSKSRC